MSIVGIDLGTTFCAVAHLDERGKAVTIPNRDGEVLTPSAVFLTGTGEAVVGQPALDVAMEQPDKVATMVKRQMGRPEYGRTVAGRYGNGAGFNVYPLRTTAAFGYGDGFKVEKTGRRYSVSQTQEMHSMQGRPIAIDATLDEYKKDPQFAEFRSPC